MDFEFGLITPRVRECPDRLGRSDVCWTLVCMQLPDDSTDALPLLRSVILNDSKSSTYKLALLRVIARIADSAVGLAAPGDDDRIRIPLGLVALYWIRMFKPLLLARLPQTPEPAAGRARLRAGRLPQHPPHPGAGQPKGLRLAEMLGNGPMGWEEQRRAFDFRLFPLRSVPRPGCLS